MHWIDICTWLAALVLIGGSLAVFVWFLRDVRTMLDGEREVRARPADDDVA